MNEFLDHDEDLIVVSEFEPTCPKCRPWGGRILSISGKTKGYPSYADAEDGGLFHPNCRHSFSLFIPEIHGEPDGEGRLEVLPEVAEQVHTVGDNIETPKEVSDLEVFWAKKERGHTSGDMRSTLDDEGVFSDDDLERMREAIFRYSGKAYDGMRSAEYKWEQNEYLDDVVWTESYLEKAARFPADKKIYRGLRGPEAISKHMTLKPGDVYELKSLTSTTSKIGVARDFAGGTGQGVILQIEGGAPVGTSIRQFSKYNNEDEVLLSGINNFKVTEVGYNKNKDYVVTLKFDSINEPLLEKIRAKAKELGISEEVH